jgi:transposase
MPRKGISLRDDCGAASCRALAKASKDAGQCRRLLSIAAVYDGESRAAAAMIGGMDRQTLRDWVHRFNVEGADGLCNRIAPGRERWLDDEQMCELAEIVETGPDLETDGVIRWRRIDLKRVIEERFGVVYAERSISRLLAELDFSHMSVRPQHPEQDGEVIDAFKKTSGARFLLT